MRSSTSVGLLRPARTEIARSALTRLRLSIAFWLSLWISAFAWTQPAPSEQDAKAAYLFNFGKFLRLADNAPPQHDSTFDICILGRDSFGPALDHLAAHASIDGRPVRVLRVPDVTDAKLCQILFISASEADNIREDLAILSGADALTVSDAPDFLDRGGMIQFLLEDNHVRFAVNLDAVNRAHLVLSSELLRVAASIKGKPEPEMPR